MAASLDKQLVSKRMDQFYKELGKAYRLSLGDSIRDKIAKKEQGLSSQDKIKAYQKAMFHVYLSTL